MESSSSGTPLIEDVEIKNSTGIRRFLIDILETILLSVFLYMGINAITARIRVDGYSMEPTLHHGQNILVNRLAYKLGKPVIGDVIVFRFPRNPNQEYIKRVIGLPGDRIEIRDGVVLINEKVLDEPYIADTPNYLVNTIVPERSLFVLGDNRNHSSDSHSWGHVPFDDVIGKAIIIYWPPQNWGLIKSHTITITNP